MVLRGLGHQSSAMDASAVAFRSLGHAKSYHQVFRSVGRLSRALQPLECGAGQ